MSIKLSFIGMRKMNIIGWQRYYNCDIFDCYLAIHNDLIVGLDENLIVWADNGNFNPKKLFEGPILSEPESSFIVSEKLIWYEL